MSFTKKQSKMKAIKPEVPYKRSIASISVVEDVELATKLYGYSNKYEMILMASMRAYDIAHGAKVMVDETKGKHKPVVTAILEAQHGFLRPMVDEARAEFDNPTPESVFGK